MKTQAETRGRLLPAKEHGAVLATIRNERRSKEGFPSAGFRESRALLTPLFQTSGPQNCKNTLLLSYDPRLFPICYGSHRKQIHSETKYTYTSNMIHLSNIMLDKTMALLMLNKY